MANHLPFSKFSIFEHQVAEQRFQEVMEADVVVRADLIEVLQRENPQEAKKIGEMWRRFQADRWKQKTGARRRDTKRVTLPIIDALEQQ